MVGKQSSISPVHPSFQIYFSGGGEGGGEGGGRGREGGGRGGMRERGMGMDISYLIMPLILSPNRVSGLRPRENRWIRCPSGFDPTRCDSVPFWGGWENWEKGDGDVRMICSGRWTGGIGNRRREEEENDG